MGEGETNTEIRESSADVDGRTRDIGAKALASEPTEEKLDPFWGKHPDLLSEARELGAPLTAREFKEQGFRFEKTDSGEYHILAPTPQYQEFLHGARPAEPIREDVRDRERHIINDDWASKGNIDAIFGKLFPDQDYTPSKKRRLRREVPRLALEYFQNRTRVLKNDRQIRMIYQGAVEKGLEDDAIAAVSDDLLLRSANDYLSEYEHVKNVTKSWDPYSYEYNYVYADESPIVAQEILGNRQMELLGDSVKAAVTRLSPEKLTQIKNDSIKGYLKRGGILLGMIAKMPEEVRGVLESPDANTEEIIRCILDGYESIQNGDDKKKVAEFFDLENQISGIDETPGNGFDMYVEDGHLLYIHKKAYWGNQWSKIPDELSGSIIARHKQSAQEIIDRIRQNPDFLSTLDEDRESSIKKAEQEAYNDLMRCARDIQNTQFNFNVYLSAEKIPFSAGKVRRFIDGFCGDESSARWWHEVKDPILSGVSDVSIDYTGVLSQALKDCLQHGVDTRGKDVSYLTEIFDTAGFLSNYDKLGIDFKDPEIMKLAFDGFINTLGTRNGETSNQADWYYYSIFANDPGKFLSMVKALREDPNTKRGIKGKLTRFFDHNPLAFEDKVRDELEKRFENEINDGHRTMRASVLRTVNRGQISGIIENYKDRLIKTIKAKGAEDISTFVGERQMSGQQRETGTEDRKEVPFDFGLEKGNALLKYGSFVETTFPNCNIQWFVDTFPQGKNGNVKYDDENSYIGFTFEYNGKLCVIAESLNGQAATYLWRSEIGDDLNEEFREMFDMARFDAKRTSDPRIVSVNHLDKEHFDDSIDEVYQKAFIFFNSGDKREVLYKNFGGREGWEAHRDQVLEAWPLGVDQEHKNYPEGLEAYHRWQQRQAEIQDRLKRASEQGGREAVERELRQIAEEDYLAMYEGNR